MLIHDFGFDNNEAADHYDDSEGFVNYITLILMYTKDVNIQWAFKQQH